MQQRPTCTNIRIRSTRDAHKIFYAVQHNLLPMVTRRLDADERLALCSGCVYAWEERGPHTEITGLGIERFTEGRRWSPSRVRDEFLFYYEKYTPPADASQSGSSPDKQPPRDWDPLVKQTYSVWVETEKGRRKWHLTAYFTQATVDQLGTIDDIPGVAELIVPEGTFQSTRVSKSRKGDDSRARNNDVLKPSTSTVTRTYAPFPSAYPTSIDSSNLHRESQRPGLGHTQQENYYNQSTPQIPQYSVPPPLLPSSSTPYSLPPLRAQYEPDMKSRRLSVPSFQHPEYNYQGLEGRRASMDRMAPRMDDPVFRSVSVAGTKGETQTEGRLFANLRPHGTHLSLSSSYSSPDISMGSVVGPSNHMSPVEYSSPPSEVTNTITQHSSAYPSRVESQYTNRPLYPSSLPPPASSVSRSPYNAPTYLEHNHHSSAPYSHSSPNGLSIHTSSPPGAQALSLPPPAKLFPTEPPSQLYEVTSSPPRSTSEAAGPGPCRVDLAPLHSLQRNHPYRRDPIDDKALRLLGPRPA